MNQITTILLVESIEASLAFWVDRLGFEIIAQVPEGESIGFAMLGRGPLQIMLQTFAGQLEDLPDLPVAREGISSMIYLSVSDLDAIEALLDGVEIVVERRLTFYGATEIWVREPGGHVVGFAQHEG